MDYAAILALIEKGISVVGVLLQAKQNAQPALDALGALAKNGQTGTVTSDQLAQTEALLDKLIADFNAPLD